MSGAGYFREAVEALAPYVPGIQPEGDRRATDATMIASVTRVVYFSGAAVMP